jgi:hypothetical protein
MSCVPVGVGGARVVCPAINRSLSLVSSHALKGSASSVCGVSGQLERTPAATWHSPATTLGWVAFGFIVMHAGRVLRRVLGVVLVVR